MNLSSLRNTLELINESLGLCDLDDEVSSVFRKCATFLSLLFVVYYCSKSYKCMRDIFPHMQPCGGLHCSCEN
jgi:hypothetical protein